MNITIIKEQVAKVISYSQRFDNPQVDNLIDTWFESKKKFINAWNGCVYEVPGTTTFELDDHEKRSRVNEFINVVDDRYRNMRLVRFLEWATMAEIFNNKIERDYTDGECLISAGTKLVKAFKHFETNEQLLRELQDRMSMLIQEDKVSGKLCFSVHPLDFLSASENTHHWRSCHALDGDYRAGNLSYLLDKSTVICYLKTNGELVKLPNFPEDVPWNSKKWRMWLFMADDWTAMFAGRQYPFFSRTALDAIKDDFLPSITSRVSNWSNWHNDYITTFPANHSADQYHRDFDLNGRHIVMRHHIYDIRSLITDVGGDDALHFNDILDSSFYIPYYCWYRGYGAPPHWTIGSYVPCLHCNENHIYRTSMMLCDPCEITFGNSGSDDHRYCSCCDTRTLFENMVYIEGRDDYICQDCFDEYGGVCQNCGFHWYATDLTFNSETSEWLCPYCYSDDNDGFEDFDFND